MGEVRGIGIDVRGGTYQDLVVYSGAVRLGTRTYPNADATWHHLRVEMRRERYRVMVDGLRVLDCSDWQPTTGRIALPAYTGGAGACLVYYDNVIVTTLAPVTVGPADSTVRTRGE